MTVWPPTTYICNKPLDGGTLITKTPNTNKAVPLAALVLGGAMLYQGTPQPPTTPKGTARLTVCTVHLP